MAAAFIASITVSAITAKLTSYLGSIVIVGLSSVLLAIFNALYERFFKASKKAAAKAILHVPHSDALPDTIAEKLHDAADDTGVIGVPDDGSGNGDGPDSGTEDDSTEIITDDTVGDGIEGAEASSGGMSDDGDDDQQGSLWESIWHGITHPNHVTKVIAAMAIMAIMTSLISWGVATFVEKPDVTNVTVRESKVEKLSDSEKNAIKQAAAAEVSNQIRQAQKSADAANGTAGSLNDRVSALESRLKTMQESVDSLSRNTGSNQQESSDISAMRQQISQMRQEIDQLKSQNANTPSPSPSSSQNRSESGTMGSSGN